MLWVIETRKTHLQLAADFFCFVSDNDTFCFCLFVVSRAGGEDTINALASIVWDIPRKSPAVVMAAADDIKKGEELVVDYGKQQSEMARQQKSGNLVWCVFVNELCVAAWCFVSFLSFQVKDFGIRLLVV